MTSLTRLASQAFGFDIRPSNNATVKDDYVFYIELGIVAFVTFLVLGHYVLWPEFTKGPSMRPPKLWVYSLIFGVAYMVIAAFYHLTLRQVAAYVDKQTVGSTPPSAVTMLPTPLSTSTGNASSLPLLGQQLSGNPAANAVPADGVISPALAMPGTMKVGAYTADSSVSPGAMPTAQPYLQSAVIPIQKSTMSPTMTTNGNRSTSADLRSIIFGPGRKAM
jgi:hypothetical protein